MRTQDDLWMHDGDAWGLDRFAWEDEGREAEDEVEEPAARQPEDPRY